jgi:hypothetical protein
MRTLWLAVALCAGGCVSSGRYQVKVAELHVARQNEIRATAAANEEAADALRMKAAMEARITELDMQLAATRAERDLAQKAVEDADKNCPKPGRM